MSICLGIKQIFEKSSPSTSRLGTYSDIKRRKSSSILNVNSSSKNTLITNQVDIVQESIHSVEKSRLSKGIVDSDLSDGKCKSDLVLKKKRKTLHNSDLFGTYDNFLHRSHKETRNSISSNNNLCSPLKTVAKITQSSFFIESPLFIDEAKIYQDDNPLVDTPPSEYKEKYGQRISHCRLDAMKTKDIIRGGVSLPQPQPPIISLTFDQDETTTPYNDIVTSTSTATAMATTSCCNKKKANNNSINDNSTIQNALRTSNTFSILDSQGITHNSNDSWKCPQCTLINHVNNNSCEVCGNINPTQNHTSHQANNTSTTAVPDVMEMDDHMLPFTVTTVNDHLSSTSTSLPPISSLLTPPPPPPAVIVLTKEPLTANNITTTSTTTTTTSTTSPIVTTNTLVPPSTTWTCTICTYENTLPPNDMNTIHTESPLRSLKGRPNRKRNRMRIIKCEICDSPMNTSQLEVLIKNSNSSNNNKNDNNEDEHNNKFNKLPKNRYLSNTTTHNNDNQNIDNSNYLSSNKNYSPAIDNIPFDSSDIFSLTQTSTSTIPSLKISNNDEIMKRNHTNINHTNNQNPKNITVEEHEVNAHDPNNNYPTKGIDNLGLNYNTNSQKIDITQNKDSSHSSNITRNSLHENKSNGRNMELPQVLQNGIQNKLANNMPRITTTSNFISIEDDEDEVHDNNNEGGNNRYKIACKDDNQYDPVRVISSSTNNRTNRISRIFYDSEDDDCKREEQEIKVDDDDDCDVDDDLEEVEIEESEWIENQQEEEDDDDEENDQGGREGKTRVLSDQEWDALFLMSQCNVPSKKNHHHHQDPTIHSLIDLTSVSSPVTMTTSSTATKRYQSHSLLSPLVSALSSSYGQQRAPISKNILEEDDISDFDDLPNEVHTAQCTFPEPALAAHFRCVKDLIANRESSIDFSKFMMNIQEPSILKYDKRKSARETKDNKKKTVKNKKSTSSTGKGKWAGFNKGKRFAKKS